jgi:hypothetical protein
MNNRELRTHLKKIKKKLKKTVYAFLQKFPWAQGDSSEGWDEEIELTMKETRWEGRSDIWVYLQPTQQRYLQASLENYVCSLVEYQAQDFPPAISHYYRRGEYVGPYSVAWYEDLLRKTVPSRKQLKFEDVVVAPVVAVEQLQDKAA